MRNQSKSQSFRNLDPEKIETAGVVRHFHSPFNVQGQGTSGLETFSVAWAPDYSCFAWSYGNRKVDLIPWTRSGPVSQSGDCLLNRNMHQPFLTLDCGEYVFSLAFGVSQSGRSLAKKSKVWTRFRFDGSMILATGLQSGKIRLWNCSTGDLLMELIDHKSVVKDMHFDPDGSLHLASASSDGTVKIWDLPMDGNMYCTIRPHYNSVFCKIAYGCRWSRARKFLACVSDLKCVMLYHAESHESFQVVPVMLEGHNHNVVSCDFSNDGALLATASYDTRVIIWDPYTGDALCDLYHMYPPPRLIYASGANDHYVRSVSFCTTTAHIASVSDDGYVRFWRLGGQYDPAIVAENGDSLCCQYSPSGNILAVGCRNGSVDFYESPKIVESLQHLCRSSIRKILPTQFIECLKLPGRVKDFLKYKDLQVAFNGN